MIGVRIPDVYSADMREVLASLLTVQVRDVWYDSFIHNHTGAAAAGHQ